MSMIMSMLRAMLPLLPYLLVAVVIIAGQHFARRQGLNAGRAEVQAAWHEAQMLQMEMGKLQLQAVIERTEKLGDQIAAIQTANQQGHADAKRASQTLIDGLRNGTIRLSVPAVAASSGPAPAGPGGPTAGPGQARTELDPATGASLVAITDDGDAGIRDLNTCIDAYERVRTQVNGPAPTEAAP